MDPRRLEFAIVVDDREQDVEMTGARQVDEGHTGGEMLPRELLSEPADGQGAPPAPFADVDPLRVPASGPGPRAEPSQIDGVATPLTHGRQIDPKGQSMLPIVADAASACEPNRPHHSSGYYFTVAPRSSSRSRRGDHNGLGVA